MKIKNKYFDNGRRIKMKTLSIIEIVAMLTWSDRNEILSKFAIVSCCCGVKFKTSTGCTFFPPLSFPAGNEGL